MTTKKLFTRFEASLFVYIRKRLGVKKLEDTTVFMMKKRKPREDKHKVSDEDFTRCDVKDPLLRE